MLRIWEFWKLSTYKHACQKGSFWITHKVAIRAQCCFSILVFSFPVLALCIFKNKIDILLQCGILKNCIGFYCWALCLSLWSRKSKDELRWKQVSWGRVPIPQGSSPTSVWPWENCSSSLYLTFTIWDGWDGDLLSTWWEEWVPVCWHPETPEMRRGGGKGTAELPAEPVITGTNRAGGWSMERRAHSEYGGSYGLYLELLHSCVVTELN